MGVSEYIAGIVDHGVGHEPGAVTGSMKQRSKAWPTIGSSPTMATVVCEAAVFWRTAIDPSGPF